MTCYYPLPGLSQGIGSSLTYSVFTLNEATGALRAPQRHRLDLALYRRPEGATPWLLVDRLSPDACGDIVARSEDYSLGPGDLLVAVPVSQEARSEPQAALLPLPASKRVDRAPVAERCSLAFHWRGINSSYQGEFPLRMAELSRGTMVSFDPLLHASVPGALTLVCLVNISRRDDPTPLRLEVFEAHSRRLLREVSWRRNGCALLALPDGLEPDGELVFRSTDAVGIPIFITISGADGPASMSVEHTHPPTELFWEQDRIAGSRALKTTWLGASLQCP
ncbi:hypothetical protein NZK32_05715 [Cyanobium sp. FGCU-52]|nr:hypothetical protein [Cyanobium sp. FGCU52]